MPNFILNFRVIRYMLNKTKKTGNGLHGVYISRIN